MVRTRPARAAGLLCVTFSVLCGGVSAGGESPRPIVPGFERFGEADPAAGGRILLSELNCTACHAADETLAAWLSPKPAPVLDTVSTRVKREYLRRFLADPQAVDPGTTMPDLFAGVDPATRDAQVEMLVHFLSSGGTVSELRSDPAAAERGETLFHAIGCAVCHGRRGEATELLPTSVPLGDLGEKYAIPSLAEFLRDPHVVRPGGRMPNLNLDEQQALDVAHFLIPDSNPKPKDPRVTYKVYAGGYGNLPDFDALTPIDEGSADEFDASVAGRSENFAIVFEGFLKIDRAAEYWFLLASDDGSRLLIDGETVSDNDGVHPMMTVRGAKKLEPGIHPLRVEYAQVAGDQKLSVQYEGPGLPRQPIVDAVYLTREATRPEPTVKTQGAQDDVFRPNPALAEKGRKLFASLGCASCHQKQVGDVAIASSRTAPSLSAVSPARGCLADSPQAPAVRYGLTDSQRLSLITALEAVPVAPLTDADRVDDALVRFNCYACHERGGKGGVESSRNDVFTTTVPEMGDEGRIPPHLTGIGDKLHVDWLRHLLGNGASDRGYMQTRMPNFGSANVGFLAEAFAAVDQRGDVTLPELDLPKHRVISVGRQLVGGSALSCIKCHDFGEYAGTGIRAIDLQTMTKRLRQDWFVRYMLDPQQYRPGTRMPSAFPKGKSAVRDVLDGNADRQLAAIWTYLELGFNAPVPAGVVGEAIVLEPTDRPILYRNFLEGVSARGIAVGYPEQANLAFDADEMCLALIWHDAFIDAAKHWNGRGSGNQRPLGDHVLSLVRGVTFAALPEEATAWPSAPATEQGWKFLGYRLDEQGRPRFRYGTDAFTVEDFPQPLTAEAAGTSDAVIRRILTVSAPAGLPNGLHVRAAAGRTIEHLGGTNFLIDEALTIRLSPHPDAAKPIVRESAGQQELLVPLPAGTKRHLIDIDYEW